MPEHDPIHSHSLLVGIGASAGGLKACKQLIAGMPADTGIAFVVILHLDPSHTSHLPELLQAATAMKVVQVTDPVRVAADHVYVIAPNASLHLHEGVLSPQPPTQPHGARKPIDAFFSSLAADHGERAVAVVLSGTGDDGSSGIQDVRRHGGLCLVQEPESAEHDGMPESAIDTTAAHHVVPPEAMPALLIEYAASMGSTKWAASGASDGEHLGDGPSSVAFDSLLGALGERYGVDFRPYKLGTIERRVQRRMDVTRQNGWAQYLDYVRANPEELVTLYNDLLIGVTCFFREPEAWAHLEQELLPDLLHQHDPQAPLRAWVAGCATGEEAYTLAIVLLEQLERAELGGGLRIYATDIDGDALTFARRGLYPKTIERQVSPERLRRYFQKQGDEYQVCAAVRAAVTFAPHNLLSDPPFSRLDLVSCRNVLIYLKPAVQQAVLEVFDFALRPQGILVLGSSENVGRHTDLFETLSKRWRIYRSVAHVWPGRYHLNRTPSGSKGPKPLFSPVAGKKTGETARLVEQAVLSRHAAACVAVTENFDILYFFGPTNRYLTQPTGEARLDLLSWAQPALYPKLRAALLEAVAQKRKVTVSDMRIEGDGVVRLVECSVEPIADGVLLAAFVDLPAPGKRGEVDAAEQPLVRQLDDELDRTREELQKAIEELNRTSEEYRINHEEMLSLNEELQSSNEELETSKEELHSLNEEINAVNRQIEQKNAELQSTNTDLRNLLTSTAVPTIFLDRQFRIKFFTPPATELMRLVPSDVGRAFQHVKERFRDEQLLVDAQQVLDKLVPVSVEIATEDGRWYVRRIVPYRTEDDRIDGVCITFSEITDQKRATAQAQEARLFAESIVRTVRTPLVVLDANCKVVSANENFYHILQLSPDQTLGRSFYELDEHQWDIPQFRKLLDHVLPESKNVRNYAVEHTFSRLGWRYMQLNASVMELQGRPALVLVSIEDMTEWKKAHLQAQEHALALKQEHARKDQFLAMLGHELRNPMSALVHGLELLEVRSGDEQVEKTRQMMMRQAGRVTAMLDQLLDIARITSGKIEIERKPVDLGHVVRTAIEAVQPMIRKRSQELTTSLVAGRGLCVLGDSIRLTQLVENLLMNAVKYTDERGKIELAVAASGDTVAITVRDDGCGIESDLLGHVFELFTQSARVQDRAQGGLGLGLALARSIVELHGGEIRVSSDGMGRGSEFVVTLPRIAEQRETAPERTVTQLRAADQPRRVLVADDEIDIASTLAEILGFYGHDAVSVHDGPAALEAFQRFEPEVVLLDIGLPGMDGYEVARRMRAADAKHEVLLVAVTGFIRDDAKLAAAGFDRHLLKPPELEQVRNLIADWEGSAQRRVAPAS